MIKLDQKYARQDFIDFLQDTFLQDYVRDVRPVGTAGRAIHKATSLGRSETLDLQVFEFEYAGSVSKRVALTKEAFQIMKQSATFNALAIFYGENSDDWRLSFLTANPEKTEKGKVTLAYSNPRRYSFFLGPNAKINTPYRFLVKNGQIKDYEDLLSRFNVEIVTKEFFENYKKLFDRLLGYLKKDHAFQLFASRNGVDTTNFAKKLLGQIVFLYFLQRKGWLGARKSDSISAGDKDFLRSLFNKSIEEKRNFYNEYLEKLFYGALNRSPEKAGSYYRSYFDCQIPFLNGGLFEPPEDYDWEREFLILPDKLFSSNPKDPNKGDGILDIFDLYNFTVDESDFLDKEVSVDPEMLGKVFENLLEENLRKGKGTYYTPREIVNYMCEESVVNYLATEIGMTPDDIKNKYFPAYNVLGDEKVEVRDVSISEQIIESLKNIKVVDPACGSGAFLVGMLQQITHLRYELEARSKLLGRRTTASTEYEIKKQSIQNCIYGVDIDPGAVEIAKLRLWLSLVVDYDLEDIEPLPNLDYKIMQGNSLLEELVLGDTTIKLYDRQTIQKAVNSKRMKNLFDEDPQMAMFDDIKKEQALKNMKALQVKYFSQSDANEKKKIRTQIEKIEHDLIEASVRAETDKLSAQRLNIRTLPGVGLLPEDAKRLMAISSKESQIMAVLDELKKTGTKPFFLWHLHFADVFEQKGGFDVVIANPPYVTTKYGKIDEQMKKAYSKRFYSAYDKLDLYILFIEQAIRTSKDGGFTTFITPWNFLKNFYSFKIRKYILDNCRIVLFYKLPPNVFESAIVDNIISIFEKHSEVHDNKILFDDIFDKTKIRYVNQSEYIENDKFVFSMPVDDVSRSILDRMKQDSVQLGSIALNYIGIMTGGQKKMIADSPVFANSKPVLSGKESDKWFYTDIGRYVNFDRSKIHSNDNEDVFLAKRKILLRKTGRDLVACLDEKQFYTIQSLYNIVINNHEYSEEYILCLLNSKLFTYIYNKFFITNPEVFPYIKRRHLDQLPIKQLALKLQRPFIEMVGDIFSISLKEGYPDNHSERERVKVYEKQIDQMVYELYGLTGEEIRIVEGKNE